MSHHEETASRLLNQLSAAMGQQIEELLKNDDVVEIMLNPDGRLWADSHSRGRYDSGHRIASQLAQQIVFIVASSVGAICNDKNPVISAELPSDGSRFQGMLPPIVANPTFTIRKKAILVYTLEQYVESKIISLKQYETILNAIAQKKTFWSVAEPDQAKQRS